MKESRETKDRLIDELHQQIAELKESENKLSQMLEALREKDERYHQLLEHYPEAIALHSEGRFIYINPAGMKLLGASCPAQIVGREILDIVPPESRDVVMARVHETQVEERPTPLLEMRLIRLDAEMVDVEVMGMPIAHLGKPATQIVIRDISARKRAEQALRESEKRYRLLVETMNDGLGICNADGVITYVNDKVCEMEGYTREEKIGRYVFDFLDEENRKIIKDELSKRREGRSSSYEVTWTGKNGKKIPTIMSAVPILDENGTFQGSFAIITDITERKKMESALLESEKLLRIRARELEESNSALKVLLKQRENDKRETEEKILSNVKQLILPYVKKLKNSRQMPEETKTYLKILESNLKEIISPFSFYFSSKYGGLTPQEIQIANLIRDGKQDKDVAEIISISPDTVKSHRKNIRKKLGITGTKTNLRTYLLSLT